MTDRPAGSYMFENRELVPNLADDAMAARQKEIAPANNQAIEAPEPHTEETAHAE